MAGYDLGAATGTIVLGYDGKGVDQAKSGLSSLSSLGSNVMRTLGGALTSAATAAAALGTTLMGIAVTGGIARQLKIEDAQAKLKGLGNDTKTVEAIMNSALASVEGTAYGLDTAATVAATAVAAGIAPGKELESYLRLTADAATIAGTSMEEMGSIINKTTTAGVVYADNLNQLADRGIPIFTWLQDEYGVTATELRKMVSDGKVDSETFRKVIEKNIGGAALESGNTTRGAFANMMAALSRTGQAMTRSVFPYFKDFFNGIREGLNALNKNIGPVFDELGAKVGPMLGKLGESIGKFLGSIDVSAIVDGIKQLGPLIAPVIGLLAGSLGSLMGQIPIIGGMFSWLTGPIGLVAGAVVGLMMAFPQLREAAVSAIQEVVGSVRAFVAAFKAGDGDITSSGLPGFFERLAYYARVAFDGIVAAYDRVKASLSSGSMPKFDISSLLGVGVGIAAIGATIAGFMGKLGPLGGAVLRIVGSFSGLSGVIAKLAPVLRFLGGPIGIIVGLLATLYATNSDVRDVINELAGVVFDAAGQIGSALIPIISQLAETLFPVLMSVISQVMGVFGELLVAVVPLISELVSGLAPVLVTLISSLLPPLVAVLGLVGDIIANVVMPIFGDLISVLAGALIPVIETLLPIVVAVFKGIASAIKAAMTVVSGIITVVSQALSGDWSGAWGTIKSAASTVLDWLIGPLVSGFNSAKDGITSAFSTVGQFFTGVWDGIKIGAQGLSDFFVGVWNGIVNTALTMWELFKTNLQTVWDAISPIITVPLQMWQTLFTTVWETIKTIVAVAIVAVQGILTGNMELINQAITMGWERIKNVFSQAWASVKGTAIGAWNAIKSIFSNAWSAITGAVSTAWGSIKSFFSNGFTAIKNAASDGWTKVKTSFSNGITAAVNFVRELPGKISSALSNLTSTLQRIATDAWNGFKSKVSEGISKAVNTVKELPGKIKGALSGAASWLYDAGRNVIQGLINGIKNMASSAVSAAKGVVDGAIAGAKKLLGIASPSKVFFEIGLQTVAGLVNALGKAASSAGKAAAKVASAVVDNGSADLELQYKTLASFQKPRQLIGIGPSADTAKALLGLAAAMRAKSVVAGSDTRPLHIGNLTIEITADEIEDVFRFLRSADRFVLQGEV